MNTYLLKLQHNYHELNHQQKLRYWIFDRWKLSKEDRFFFEGQLSLPGQMYIEDRKALYKIILEKKPKYCFEVGTFKGGGSTFFLASAFAQLGYGKLITLESEYRFYQSAEEYYRNRLPKLRPSVEFLHGVNNGEKFQKFSGLHFQIPL